MTNLKVWVSDNFDPLTFNDVEYYHESRHKLEIVQEELYKTVTTVIYKDSILRYQVYEKR